MSKSTVTLLFSGAVVAEVAGTILAVAAVVAALANGAVTIGGPAVLSVSGDAIAGSLLPIVVASAAAAGGAILAFVSWVGALANTVQLEDKTWFVALLVLGLVSFGFVAMVAYLIAGPDSRTPGLAGAASPTTTHA